MPTTRYPRFSKFVGQLLNANQQIRIASFDEHGKPQPARASKTGVVKAMGEVLAEQFHVLRQKSAEAARNAIVEARQSVVVAEAINHLVVGDRNDLSYRLVPDKTEKDWFRVQAIRPISLPNGTTVKVGELGGLVRGMHNLHQGGSWIGKNARVSGNATVGGGAYFHAGAMRDESILTGPQTFVGAMADKSCVVANDRQEYCIRGFFMGSARVSDGKLLTEEGEVPLRDIKPDSIICDTHALESASHGFLLMKPQTGLAPGRPLVEQVMMLNGMQRRQLLNHVREYFSPAPVKGNGLLLQVVRENPHLLKQLGLKLSAEVRLSKRGQEVDPYIEKLIVDRAKAKGLDLGVTPRAKPTLTVVGAPSL